MAGAPPGAGAMRSTMPGEALRRSASSEMAGTMEALRVLDDVAASLPPADARVSGGAPELTEAPVPSPLVRALSIAATPEDDAMEERQRGLVLSPTSPGPNSDARSDIRVAQEGRRVIGCDESGGWVWEAAETLEEALFAQYPKGLKEKRILELGAGTGWLALRLACCGAYVRATDRGERLGLLLRNIAANERRFAAAGRAPFWIEAEELDWEEAEIELDADGLPVGVPVGDARAEIVVGSDLIYLHELHAPLLLVLGRLTGSGARIFLSWEERKPKEEASFLELAKVAGFACKELLRQKRDGGFVAWDRSASGERTLVAYEFKLSKGKPAGKQRPAFQRQPSSGTQRRPSKA